MNFSIIIPCYNSEKTIEACIQSAMRQSVTTEVIVVDDCSTDATWSIINWIARDHQNVRCFKTSSNGGPGRARNEGLMVAKGDWILFLDADDTLEEDATIEIAQFIRTSNYDCDVIGFDWRYSDGDGGRKDKDIYFMDKKSLMKEFLSLRTDGSVIYTAIKRELIEKYDIRFPECHHEDVEFIFKVYWYAEKMRYLDRVLYSKQSTEGSIVNTISEYHIGGFMGVWSRIGGFLRAKDVFQDYKRYYDAGCYGALATRLREIYRMDGGIAVYKALYNIWDEYFRGVICPKRMTKYIKMAASFLFAMSVWMSSKEIPITDDEKLSEIEQFMDDMVGKSWSCYDLHHSVFLAPDEIRTCCKRFFLNGEMKGDVVLLDKDITADNIEKARMKLYTDINAGKKTPCDGCPFLEFKDWEPMGIEYLSLEYHSVCNLKCSYCSDTFYGGKQPSYDVETVISSFEYGLNPMNLKTVLWGGGEPTLGKYFNPQALIDRYPRAHHRVLTNSVKHSEIIESLLKKGLIHVTTSVDAGTRETFKTVRGKDTFIDVFLNIVSYANANARKVTIKYILTNENSSPAEILAFVTLVKAHALQGCNFQLSCDFNYEHFKSSTVKDLYDRLIRAGCEVVFVDDLLRLRMGKTMGKTLPLSPVVIWGAGDQAKLLMDNTVFFKRNPVQYFVDDTKVGEIFMDKDVRAPVVLLRDDSLVVIAAVQGYPLIYDRMVKMGIENRLIKELML